MADLYRIIVERFDIPDKQFNKLMEKMRSTNQHLAGLEHEAWQPRLDKKTRKRNEGAAAVDRAKHNGDSSSARKVDDGPTSLTSFGEIAEPPVAPKKRIGDSLVNKGAEVPKPHLPPVEVRMLSSAADGLLPAGTAYSDEDHLSPVVSLELLPD